MEQSRTGLFDHKSKDGSSPWDRIKRYTKIRGGAAENLQAGRQDPKGVVMQLAIDANVASRGHRKAILNPRLKQIGSFTAPHPNYGQSTVLDYMG